MERPPPRGVSHYHCVCGALVRRVRDAELHMNLCMVQAPGETTYHFDVSCTLCGMNIRRSSINHHLKTHLRKGEIENVRNYHVNEHGFIVMGQKLKEQDLGLKIANSYSLSPIHGKGN